MRWLYSRSQSQNFTYPLVDDFLTKKMLAKMGYQFDYNELETYEVEAYHLIENAFDTIKNQKRK